MWCSGRTLAWNARDMGLSLALGTISPIIITPIAVFISENDRDRRPLNYAALKVIN